MELATLINALSDPKAYPFPTQSIEVSQTHISVVFLTERIVYKIKKPVTFSFLDFSSLSRRRHDCEEEVRANARLAPGVYHGVVPVVYHGGVVRVEGDGEVVEWAVKMDRLPDQHTLEKRIQNRNVTVDLVADLGEHIGKFHNLAARGPRIAAGGRFDVVAKNVRQNFDETASHVNATVSKEVFTRARSLSEDILVRSRALVESRAAGGVPCDTHGDLRLEHVYTIPGRSRDGFTIIDAIEFNESFRFADPVADMAFLVMDFVFHGRRDLAKAFTDRYFQTRGDDQGRSLLPLYCAYRAIVRAKVEFLKSAEPEVTATDRLQSLSRARAFWLLALGELEHSDRRLCLILVGGLPGSGKSTLARELAQRADFSLVRSDVVRKELAADAGTATGSSFEQGLYTSEWTERTYDECLRRAKDLLFHGNRVIVDASFRQDAMRRNFFAMSADLCVPARLLVCRADRALVRQRLAGRRGDVSDADWPVYVQAERHWEEIDESLRGFLHEINTNGTPEVAVRQGLQVVVEASLNENDPVAT